MGRQLIEKLWPLFCFARLLGMFPYKRILTDNGMMELRPISKKIHWGLYAFKWTLTIVSTLFVTSWIFFKRTYDQLSECLVGYNGGHSAINILALFLFLLFVTLEAILLQIGNYKLRGNVCELSSQFKIAVKPDDTLSTPIFIFIGFLMATLFTTTLYAFQLGWICHNCLDLSLINSLPLPIIHVLTYFIDAIPLFVFLAITLDLFNGLDNEIKNLTVLIGQHKLNRSTLNYVSNMIIRLEKVRSSLSFNLFCAMSCLLVEILVFLYQIPVLFFGYFKNNKGLLLLGATHNLLCAIRLLALIWFINYRAQMVTNQVHLLKDCLQETFISGKTNFNVRFEGQIVPVSFMKDCIVGKLGNFAGFDGKGYFVLGKSFTAKFIGILLYYVCILLKFHLSEK